MILRNPHYPDSYRSASIHLVARVFVMFPWRIGSTIGSCLYLPRWAEELAALLTGSCDFDNAIYQSKNDPLHHPPLHCSIASAPTISDIVSYPFTLSLLLISPPSHSLLLMLLLFLILLQCSYLSPGSSLLYSPPILSFSPELRNSCVVLFFFMVILFRFSHSSSPFLSDRIEAL